MKIKFTVERILLILLVIVVIISNLWMHSSLSNEINSYKENRGKLDPNPGNNNLGFFTINDENCVTSRGGQNVRNSIRLKNLKIGESSLIKLYIDYNNISENIIYNLNAKIYFGEFSQSHTIITASLSSNNTNTIYDTVFIENLPECYNYNFVSAKLENFNGIENPIDCAGYNYQIMINKLPTTEAGIIVGNLPPNKCARGLLAITYSLTKIKPSNF